MKVFAYWFALFVASLSGTVQAQEFKCLEGAKASAPYKPDTIVRWCEIERDGRLLYHGSVWRWHRNGQIESRTQYIYGDAEGESPAWYASGKPSSLGVFRGGQKQGLWKYWAEAGWLKTEVIHAEAGSAWTEYYQSGKKKTVGKMFGGKKFGQWIYFDESGTEKASCDLGNGVFTLPTKACELIVNEFAPKGFSRPIPIATKNTANVNVKVATQAYKFTTPKDWIADTEAGKRQSAPVVFYPRGKTWDDAKVKMYISVLYRDGSTFAKRVADKCETIDENVADFAKASTVAGRLHTGRESLAIGISYKAVTATDSPFSIVSDRVVYEQLTFLDVSDEVVLMVVQAAHTERELTAAATALRGFVESLQVENPIPKKRE